MSWIDDENFRVHFTPAIATNDDGARRSIWPEKWSMLFLSRIEHTRQYAKNYALSPIGNDGPLWSLEDFTHRLPDGISQVLVSIDPAVTQKASSDFTGLAVVGRNPTTNELVVLGCWQVKLDPERLRHRVIELVDIYDAAVILIETNQGGDLWHSILHDMPVKVRTVHQSESKEVRAASAYNLYQRGTVLHAPGAELAALEAQMTSFPNAPHDDMVDAVTSAVNYFASAAKKKRGVRVGGMSVAYN